MAVSPAVASVAISSVKSSAISQATYRADVDGLRAVAVLGVVVFHAFPGLMPGGFTGVDVFFVISGFLISGIILRALDHDCFSPLEFYVRRIRRIFPALIIMLLVIWLVAWPLLLWDEFQLLGKHMAAASAFALNLVAAGDFNLFSKAGASAVPLIHLWSLGVEEQFYFVWPLFLLLIWRTADNRGRLIAILGVAIVSFALYLGTMPINRTVSVCLPSNRMWELSLGSALAYVSMPRLGADISGVKLPQLLSRWITRAQIAAPNTLSLLGAVLIGASFSNLFYTATLQMWWTSIACLGSLLLIGAGPHGWINRHVLAHPAMVFIGLISYPLYLWHYPLLTILRMAYGRDPGALLIIATVATSLILSVATYKYLEMPIRSSGNGRRVAAMLCALMAMCAGLGYLTFGRSIPARSASYELDRFITASREDWLPNSATDWTWYTNGPLIVGAGARQVLFAGDRNMQQYYPRVVQLFADRDLSEHSAIFAVRAGCAPVAMDRLEDPACPAFRRMVMKYALSPDVATVVLAADWRFHARARLDDAPTQLRATSKDSGLQGFTQVIAELASHGKRVYVVLSTPSSPQFDPRRMIRRSLGSPGFTAMPGESPSRMAIDAAAGPFASRFAALVRQAGANVIDPAEWLCGELCPAMSRDGDPLYRDTTTLRPSYVRERVRFLDETLVEAQPTHAAATRTSITSSHEGDALHEERHR